jgi:hypothetical protein
MTFAGGALGSLVVFCLSLLLPVSLKRVRLTLRLALSTTGPSDPGVVVVWDVSSPT